MCRSQRIGRGLGKIQIRTQGRIMEYAAQTGGPQRLKTGTTVEVVDSIVSPMTVEVDRSMKTR